jgi:hypothetical protein
MSSIENSVILIISIITVNIYINGNTTINNIK